MFDMNPRLFHRDPNRLEVRASKIPRLLFGLFAAFLLSGMIGGKIFSVALLVVVCVAVLAALYTDRWIFDRGRRQAEYHFGLPYLHTRRVLRFEEIERIEYSESPRGTLARRRVSRVEKSAETTTKWTTHTVYTRLRFVMRNGKSYMVGITSQEIQGLQAEAARNVAEFCDKPLVPMGSFDD